MNILTDEFIAHVRRLRRLARMARLHGHYDWAWQLLGAIENPYLAYCVEDDNASAYN